MAFAGRSLQTLALGLVTGSVLSALRDCVRVPWELAHGVKLLDTGSMTTPQFYLAALLILLAVPAGDWRLRLRRPPRAWIAALALSAFGLLIHNKRGTWLAFGLAVILLSLLRRNRRLLLAILVGGVLIASIPATRNRVMGLAGMFNPKEGDRAALWVKVAPPLLREHPWGYGYKSMRHEDLKSYFRKVQSKLDHLHNNALQISAELGWLGGGFWVAWMAAALGSGLASVRRAAAAERSLAAGVCAAFFALLANGLVEYNFGDTEILMLFAILLGMIARRAGALEREGDE
ncbi:MAG: O-antigen ligase family protein [Kiritimatiellia bacterium]